MHAFITNKNKPRVNNVAGIVSITNKGFKKVLSNPNTTATIIASIKFKTWTPIINYKKTYKRKDLLLLGMYISE